MSVSVREREMGEGGSVVRSPSLIRSTGQSVEGCQNGVQNGEQNGAGWSRMEQQVDKEKH